MPDPKPRKNRARVPDDVPQRMVNQGGQLVPEPPPPQSASPFHELDPRHHGLDIMNTMLPPGAEHRNPVENVIGAAGALGVGAPMSILDYLLDQYFPQYRGLDVNLPNESGRADPRLLGLDETPTPRKRKVESVGR